MSQKSSKPRNKRPSRKIDAVHLDAVAAVFASVHSTAEMRQLLDEMLTEDEKKTLALRWLLLQRLHQGITQRKIAAELGISLCKITRGSKLLKDPASIMAQLLAKNKRHT